MENKRHEGKERIALTLLYTAIVCIHIFLTVLVVGLALYALIYFGVLSGPDDSQISAVDTVAVFAGATLFVGAIMTFFLSKLLLRPINAIINRINRLAAGDYKARIMPGPFVGSHSTVQEFTESFNRMARELEGTEMLRSDFINNFSHEFKTPIVSIAGFAKILKTGTATAEEQREYLDIIESESLRLSQMATNVLNLTKVENQTVLTDISQFNLSEQIRSCILLLSPKWEKTQIEFALDFPEKTIQANEELLKQVWINLLDNAIKFSDDPGEVSVEIIENSGQISVAIGNHGPEIPIEKQGKIFRKFYQADESHAAEGNGVGLAIVKRVVELHSGAVQIVSESGMTTFTVTLPVKQ